MYVGLTLIPLILYLIDMRKPADWLAKAFRFMQRKIRWLRFQLRVNFPPWYRQWSHENRKKLRVAVLAAKSCAAGALLALTAHGIRLLDPQLPSAAATSRCYGVFCFAPQIEPEKEGIFGFSEFLAALALMVIAWTISDFRYRFRIAAASSIHPATSFALMISIGTLTLLTDVWRAQEWWVCLKAI